MKKFSTSAAAATNHLHGAWPATVATLVVGLFLAALAFVQYGVIGTYVTAAFAASIVVSVWGTSFGANRLAESHPQLASLFASSGVRMVAPLIIALVVIVGRDQIAPIETVYYVVPLYLCMLVADVFVWVREARTIGRVIGLPEATESFARGEVG